MKRYDITIKSQLKKAGIELIKYSGKSHSRVSHEGIEVSQENGHILIDARGLYTKTQILTAIDSEVEVTIYDAKEESKEVETVEKSTVEVTPKQQQVLETLANMLEKVNYNKIPVSDIYCNMTAVTKVISPSWFDRTFNQLEELGLVKKEPMQYEIPGGYKKGEIVETYCYSLTELAFEYLGITVENEVTVEPVENDLSNLETLVGTTFNATSIVYSMNDRTEEVIVSDTNVTNNLEDFGVCTLHIAYYNILNSNIYNIWVDSNNTIVKVH